MYLLQEVAPKVLRAYAFDVVHYPYVQSDQKFDADRDISMHDVKNQGSYSILCGKLCETLKIETVKQSKGPWSSNALFDFADLNSATIVVVCQITRIENLPALLYVDDERESAHYASM